MKPDRTRLGEWLVLAAFLAVAGLVFQQIATSLTEQGAASGDPLANAAMFPRIVAWLMIGLVGLIAAAMLTGRMERPGAHHTLDAMPDQTPEPALVRRRMLLGSVAGLAAYLLVLELLGFHFATTVLMTGLFAVLGVRPWWWAVLCGLGANLLVAFVFEGILKVVLPTGIFGLSLPLGLF